MKTDSLFYELFRRWPGVALELAGEPVDELALQYMNRLSDWFFVLGRKLAVDLKAEEVIWKPRQA